MLFRLGDLCDEEDEEDDDEDDEDDEEGCGSVRERLDRGLGAFVELVRLRDAGAAPMSRSCESMSPSPHPQP